MPVILWLYVLVAFLGVWASYFLKIKFTGPNLSVPAVLLCILINCFFGFVNMGVALYEDLLFYGDISGLTIKYPLIMLYAFICALVQSIFLPEKSNV